MLPMCNTVRWDTHCGAAYAMVYRFICDAPEGWGRADGAPIPQSHSAVRAPGANDALMIMYQSSKALREAMLPHQGGWSVSEAILTAGQATADNLPAGLAEIQYMMRTPTVAMAEQITAVLDRNAEAAAMMSGCRWERHWVCKSRPGLANHAMARVVWDAMRAVGAPRWNEDARAVAREIQSGLGLDPMEAPFIEEMERLIEPETAEAILRRDLPPSQANSTSDDYTDMCWHAPTARFYIARPALKAPGGYTYPNWVMNALGGIPATIDPMVRTAARVLAASALRLLEDAAARDAAMAEFQARTGGGVGGSDWLAPLCDYAPPIHFRWPEYVETPRGRDWWILRHARRLTRRSDPWPLTACPMPKAFATAPQSPGRHQAAGPLGLSQRDGPADRRASGLARLSLSPGDILFVAQASARGAVQHPGGAGPACRTGRRL